MAPRKNKKKNVKTITIPVNTHFLKVTVWGMFGFGACFAFFAYVHIAEHVKPAAEAFFTALFTKMGDSYHSD